MSANNTNNAQQLIQTAAELFQKNGYHNTSIADIASHCGLSKASVYHHVSSKKELVMLTIKQAHLLLKKSVFSLADNTHFSKQERLKQIGSATESFFEKNRSGALVGNLALELCGSDTEIDQLIKAYFSEWINTLASLLTDYIEPNKAHELAEDLVSLTQGAIMMAAVYNSSEPLKRVNHRLANISQKNAVSILG